MTKRTGSDAGVEALARNDLKFHLSHPGRNQRQCSGRNEAAGRRLKSFVNTYLCICRVHTVSTPAAPTFNLLSARKRPKNSVRSRALTRAFTLFRRSKIGFHSEKFVPVGKELNARTHTTLARRRSTHGTALSILRVEGIARSSLVMPKELLVKK